LLYTGPAKPSVSARRFSFGPELRGHAEPPKLPCVRRRVLKKSTESLFSALLGSSGFNRPGVAGTRGALGAVLHREAGAGAHGTCVGPRAALSRASGNRSHGDTRCPRSYPARSRSYPKPGGGNRSHGDTRRPRAGLLLAVSGNFFLVASYCPTHHSRVLKKKSLAFSPPPPLLRPCRRHGFFFDFFRPCPSVVMSGAL
jgi:hypothetical protein